MDVFDAVKGLFAAAGPWAITFSLIVGLFVGLQRNKLIPEKAHLRELATRDQVAADLRERIKAIDQDRIAAIATVRAEHVAELSGLRERHDAYMKAMDANHARETEGTRRDSADWRTAYHLAAEVGKVQAAQLDELVEGYRLILALIQALPKVQPISDTSEVNNRAGRG
jgi:cell division protein ZapA (FtsZ GTPase activity inhibitor)